jgi:hypothetical protein
MADDYRSKLEQFFALVPKSSAMTQKNGVTGAEYYGEVPSGTPIIQVTNLADASKAIDEAIAKKTIVTNPTFTTLTGMSHSELLTNWKGGGIETSCNGFVMKAGQAIGVKGLGGFDVEATMIKLGKQHCWITPLSGEKPQFGDVFESRSITPGKGYENLHVGISLSVDGDDWYTIEGGQGGPSTGFDKVARVKHKYNTSDILGWVDMRLLVSGKPPLPDWLIGTWMIYSGKDYVYSINRYGEVTQKAYRPPSGGNGAAPNLDTGSLFALMGDTVKVKWDGAGGVETFTYDRWNSFPAIMERMTGVAADGSSMKGVRL